MSSCVNGVEKCVPGSPAIEGPAGSPSCSNGIDDDCDGTTDGADPSCQAAGCSNDADCDDSDPCTDDTCAKEATSAQINEVKGGCNPVGLERKVAGDTLNLSARELEAGAGYF